MAENNFGKGIKITSGFDLSAKAPLDNRTIVSTIEERDAHVTNNRAYEGMKVYVLNEKKEYTYTGTNWEESGGISDEQLEQLNTAYEHSQTKHIQTSDLEGFNKVISSDTQPTDDNILLWINTSKDNNFEDVARINDNVTSSNTTWSSEKIFEQYALKTDMPSLNGYATENYVKNEIAKAQLEGEKIDLSGYATKSELPTKTSQLTNDSGFLNQIPSEYVTEDELNAKGYLTQHQDISGKADKSELHNHTNKIVLDGITNTKVSEWDNKSDFSGNYNDLINKPTIPSIEGLATENYVNEELKKIDVTGQLTDYAKKSDLPTKTSQLTNDSGFLTSVPSEFVTETELNAKGYLTEHQDLSDYAKTTDLHNHTNKTILDGITSSKVQSWDNKSTFDGDYNSLTNKPTIPSIEGLASEEYVDEELKKIDVTSQLVDYAKKTDIPSVPTNISAFTNDKGYITGVPSEYVTETELNAKGYLTEHQDLSNYAKKTDLPTVPTNISAFTNDKGYLTAIPAEYVTETELNAKGYLTEHQDLSAYAKKTDIPSVPTKTSQLTNDSNFLTSVPSEYVTETELNAKGYLTEHQDISNKVDKVDGKGLSTNDYTTAEKNKLAGIATGATFTKVYLAKECTSYTSDDTTSTCTPAAVKKAVGMFDPKSHTHSQYLTEHQDISGKADKTELEYVEVALREAINKIGQLEARIQELEIETGIREPYPIVGTVNEDNTITIYDTLKSGIYTLKYEFEDGTREELEGFTASENGGV